MPEVYACPVVCLHACMDAQHAPVHLKLMDMHWSTFASVPGSGTGYLRTARITEDVQVHQVSLNPPAQEGCHGGCNQWSLYVSVRS